MLGFVYPKFLLLIFAIPLFYLFYGWYKRGRNKRIRKFGNPDMVDALMPERSKSRGWLKLTLFSISWFFLMLGLARPQIGAKLKETKENGAEIMIALDVSNSMLAKDYSPNRLQRAKMDISRIVDRLHSDRIGLVIFAGEAFVQLPITADYVSAKIFLNSIDNTSVPIQGTSLADAIYTCSRSFSQEAMEGSNNRAIILISDGEDHEGEAVDAARDAASEGIKVYCVGVGTPEGVPIEMENGQMLRDKEGNIVVTKLNEQILKEIADAGNGAYIKATDGSFGLSEILDNIRNLKKTSYQSIAFAEYDEQYMYFFGIALFFLLLEFLIGNRKLKKTLFLITLLLTVTSVQSFAQADRAEVRKGNKFFKNEHFKQAEVEYRKGLLKDSLSIKGNYNLGNTLYKLQDYQGAANAYASVADTVAKVPFTPSWNGVTTQVPQMDKKTKTIPYEKYQGVQSDESNYFFNLGNTLLAAQQYDKAMEAFKQSLIRNPGDMSAKASYEYAKKKMKDQQNQDNQQDQNKDNQDQNKDNQDQNKDNQDQNKDNQDQNKDNQDQNKDNQDQNKDNQDQNKDNQDKNKDNQDQNKDNQDQNKNNQDQNKDQNQDRNKDNNEQNQGQSEGKMNQQTAAQLLQAIQDKENQTQEKVNKAKALQAKSKKKDKNW